MSEARFTRGPWVLTDTGGYDIATVEPKPDTMEATNFWTVATVNKLRPEWKANARLIAAAPELLEALQQIVALEPRPFSLPVDWSEQIAACEECQRYKGHPIQNGICDTHRKPLWARERHNENEEKALGYRARHIAQEAIAKATGASHV